MLEPLAANLNQRDGGDRAPLGSPVDGHARVHLRRPGAEGSRPQKRPFEPGGEFLGTRTCIANERLLVDLDLP